MPKIAATPMIMWKWPDHEVRVVEVEVERRLAEEDAADAAGHEQRDEAEREQHGGSEVDLAAPQRADPVEGLDRGGHADAHREHRERHGGVRAHAAHEHVVAPDQEAEEADAEDGVHHRFVAEDRLAREGREQLRGHAHAGQDRDVDLRVAEEPEQVLPQQRRAALVIGDDRDR